MSHIFFGSLIWIRENSTLYGNDFERVQAGVYVKVERTMN